MSWLEQRRPQHEGSPRLQIGRKRRRSRAIEIVEGIVDPSY
jgi:hypothetical protein